MTCLASFAFLIHVSIYSEVLLVTVNMLCCVVCVAADLISQECGGGGVTVLG